MSTYSTASTHLTTREILIADAGVEDLSVLLNGIHDNVDVWLVRSDEDAMSYIFKALAEAKLSKLHLLAHGVAGGILLGNKIVTSADFSRRFDGAAQRDLDIAFWSCKTGAGAEGLAFVQAVAKATGAKVSATSGLIGAADKNGSWELDISVKPPFSEKARGEFGHVLVDSANYDLQVSSGTKPASAIKGFIDAATPSSFYIKAGVTITGTAADILDIVNRLDAVCYFEPGVNATISDGVALANLSTIKTTITGTVTANTLADTLSNLTSDTLHYVSALSTAGVGTLVVTDTTSILQLDNLSFNGTVKALSVQDTAANFTGKLGYLSSTLNTSVNVDSYSATAPTLSQLADIDAANGTGALTYTKVIGTASELVTDSAASSLTANAIKYVTSGIPVTVTGAVNLSQLALLNGTNGSAPVNYTQIKDTKAALAADSTYIKDAVLVTVSYAGGASSVAELNKLRVKTSGLITATVSDNTAALLTGISGYNNAYTISLNDSSVNAADLNTIDDKTTQKVGVTSTTITGYKADIKTALVTNASNFTFTGSPVVTVAVTVNDAASVSELNAIREKTSGLITALVSDTSAATLAGISSDTNNALTISIAGDAAATDLIVINAKVNIPVSAVSVPSVTGSAADINTVVNAKKAGDITMTTSWNSIVTGTTAAASDLNSIAATITTGTINATGVSTNITGSASAIAAAAAIADFSTVAVSVDSIATVTPQNVTDLNAIDTETSGIITATIGGALTDLLSLTNNSSNNAYTITLNDTGSVAAANLRDINLKTTPTVNANLVDTITGEASVIIAALGAGISYKSNVAINVTSFAGGTYANVAAQIAALQTIQTASAGSAITATLSGTVTDLLTLPGTNNPYTVTITPDTTANAADLNTINTKVSTVVGAANITGLTGTAAAIKTLLTARTNNEITLGTIASVVVSDVGGGVATLALDLNYIDTNTGAVVVNASGVTAISGSAANVYTTLVTNTFTTTVNNPTVIISDAPTVAQLKAINDATFGAITLTTANGALSGSAADLVAAFTGTVTQHTGTVEVSSASTSNAGVDYLAQLKAINTATNGVITLSGTGASTTLSGTAEDLALALATTSGHTGAVALTATSASGNAGADYVAQLQAINALTAGTITLTGTGASQVLSGSAEDLALALATTSGHTGAVVLTATSASGNAGADYVAQLKAINALTSGTITLTTTGASQALAGTAADLTASLDGISTYIGNITISDGVGVEITATTLSAIGGATSGTVTVTNAVAITGSQAEVTNALITKGVIAATATVTIKDNANASILATDLSAIGNATTGTVTVTNAIKITGTISEVTAALVTPASSVVAATAVVDISDSATILQLNNVDAMTSGVITATVADTAANLAKLTGTGNKYTLTVSDATPTYATDLLTIDAATTQIITATAVGTITGTAANIATVIASSGTGITLSGTVNAAITNTNVSATDLKAIDLVVGGTVNANAVKRLTGSAVDIASVLTAVSNGTITITDKLQIDVVIDPSNTAVNTPLDYSLLTAIKNAGFNSVDAKVISHIQGVAADVNTLLRSSIIFANNVAVKLTDTGITAALLNSISDKTIAKIDATSVTTMTGTATALAQALGNQEAIDTADSVAVTVSDSASAANLDTIAAATAGIVTASLAIDTAISDATVSALSHVGANDVLTFASTAVTADATALAALNTLADTKSFAATGITEAFDTANLTTVIAAALAITTGGAETVAITGGTVTVADLNTIANATTGAVTASLAVDTAITDTVVTSLANVDAADVITFASTVATADATALNDLNALADTKSFASLSTITELAAEIGASAIEITNALVIKPNAAVTITNAISAADLNTIAGATNGAVTASLAVDTAITDTVVTSLANVDANDVITFASTAVTADATALNALNTLADTKSFANLTSITEDAATIGASAAAVTNALAIKADVAVTITNAISAANLDAIAAATAGIVTATLAVDTAISDATVSALSNVSAADVITFASTATTADATALAALNTLADTKSFAATGITEAFDTANLTTVIAAALAITTGGAETVAITGGTVTAADLNTIANATTGAVTASLAVDTAITDTIVTSLANVNAADVITFASTAVTADATALVALNTLADTKSFAATGITEAFDTANLTTVITNALAITTGGAETVAITGGTITAADLDTIANATTGAVTASLAVDTAISDTTVSALSHVGANDVLTFASTAVTADARALNALNTLADTKSFANLTSITEDAATIGASAAAVTNALAITTGGAETVTITGGTITAADANAIHAATTGIITATISGTAADLADLTGTGNAYTVSVSDAATIAQLTYIKLATTGTLTYAVGISDLVTNLVSNDTVANSYITGDVSVTINSPATIAQLTAIDNSTTGTLTYTNIHDTAYNLATQDPTTGIWSVNSPYIKQGTNIIVDGNITTNELAALEVANGNGTVISASNTSLDKPNTYLIESEDTPIWTVSGGMVAKVIDAAGDQVIHIAAGGKLFLKGSDGYNVVVFDAFHLVDLTVSSSGSTVIFRDSEDHDIAWIEVTDHAPKQTIGFSDGTHVELTLTGTNYDVLKFNGDNI